MRDYGLQRSTVKPQPVEITDSKVFVSDNIHPITNIDFAGFEFALKEYAKDEYICIQAGAVEQLTAAFAYLPLEIQAAMVDNQTQQLLQSQEDLV